MKIGFIGVGNMASAIIEGIVSQAFVVGEDVYLYDLWSQKVEEFVSRFQVKACQKTAELIETVDLLVLAVKPNVIEGVLAENKALIQDRQPLLVSIAGGTPIAKLEAALESSSLPIVRVMPNVNALVGEGAAAVCGNAVATQTQVQQVLELFGTIGKAWELEEKDFSTFTALAGSSPAFAFMFIDSLARAGVKHGIPKDVALEYASQAVLGSARMILETQENPWTLIDQVSSPGGTTVAGLLAMEEEAFMATVVKGVDATIQRDREINEE